MNLIDKVSGPAFKASQSVDALNKKLAKTGKIGYTATSARTLPLVKRLNREALGTFVKSRVFNPLGEKFASGIDSALQSITRFGKHAALALGAAGVAAAGFAIKSTVHFAMFSEASRKAFALLTGDEALGEKTFTRSIELSRQLGMDLETTVHAMQKFLAQQFTPPEAEQWLKLGADLRAVGVEASALNRVFLDIAHVKATGKLNQRNLNMFANAGVSAQLILEEAAKIAKTDMHGIHKLMHKGKLTSDIALPALQRAILRKTHTSEAGEAGTGFAQNTLRGLVDQLKNAPNLFFQRMGDAAEKSIMKLKTLVDVVMKALDSVSGDQFVRFIETSLDIATKMVPLALEFANGFGEGFSSINAALGELDPAKASMQTAKDLGHAMADAFGLVLKILKKIGDLLIWIDAHPILASMAGTALLITRVLGAGLVGKGLLMGGKGAVKGVGLLGRLLGIGGAAAGAAGSGGAAAALAQATAASATGALPGVAATAGSGVASSAAGAAAGTSGAAAMIAGISAWAGTSVAAASVGAIGAAILPGLLALGAGIYWREEIAKWMIGTRPDAANHRGIDASDFPAGTPTPLLAGMQRAANGPRSTSNNVTMQTTVNIDGTGKDGADIGKDIAEGQRDGIEQWLQSQALEQGAM